MRLYVTTCFAVACSIFVSSCSGPVPGTAPDETDAVIQSSPAAISESAEWGSQARDEFSSRAADIESGLGSLNPVRPDSLGTVSVPDISTLQCSIEDDSVTAEEVKKYLRKAYLSKYITSSEGPGTAGDVADIRLTGASGESEVIRYVLGSEIYGKEFDAAVQPRKRGETFTSMFGGSEVSAVIENIYVFPDLTDDIAMREEGVSAAELISLARDFLGSDASALLIKESRLFESLVEKSQTEPTDEAVNWVIDSLVRSMYDVGMGADSGSFYGESVAGKGYDYDRFREAVAGSYDIADLLKRIMVSEAVIAEADLEITNAVIDHYLKAMGYDSIQDASRALSSFIVEQGLREEAVKQYLDLFRN